MNSKKITEPDIKYFKIILPRYIPDKKLERYVKLWKPLFFRQQIFFGKPTCDWEIVFADGDWKNCIDLAVQIDDFFDHDNYVVACDYNGESYNVHGEFCGSPDIEFYDPCEAYYADLGDEDGLDD